MKITVLLLVLFSSMYSFASNDCKRSAVGTAKYFYADSISHYTTLKGSVEEDLGVDPRTKREAYIVNIQDGEETARVEVIFAVFKTNGEVSCDSYKNTILE